MGKSKARNEVDKFGWQNKYHKNKELKATNERKL